MFSLRKNLGSNRHWDIEFISKFINDLLEGGFNQITFKKPIDKNFNAQDFGSETELSENLRKLEVTHDEFLKQERNYSAVIMVAKNTKNSDVIKVLFVNTSRATTFFDDTFPSGNSVPSQIYIQSKDPSRVYGLAEFFHNILTQKDSSNLNITIFGLIGIFIFGLELVNLLTNNKAFFQQSLKITPLVDIFLIFLSILWLSRFFNAPRGLSVNRRETATWQSYVNRTLKGDFRDNPLINLILTIGVNALVYLLFKIIGWN